MVQVTLNKPSGINVSTSKVGGVDVTLTGKFINVGGSGGTGIPEGGVTADLIADGAVTEDKLSEDVKTKLNKESSSFSGSASDVTYESDSLEATNVQAALDELAANKVDSDDNAPKLTAGFANNLVGRGEATEETIGFRASGGDTSIEDGTARIERLKGSTVVWNQLVDFSAFKVFSSASSNISIVNDGKVIIVTNNAYEGTAADLIAVSQNSKIATVGHKILVSLDFSSSNSSFRPLVEYGTYSIAINNRGGLYYSVYTTTKATAYLLLKVEGTKAIGDTWTFSNVKVIDLTQMFGAGNEPTTIEEFNARKPLGIDEYAYNEGELISTTADEIKSVGFNAWDGEYAKVIGGEQYELLGTYTSIGFSEELGGETTAIEVPADKMYTPEEDGYIYAQGTDICIHLVHTGYRNGEYEPYKEFRRSLPISEIKDSEGNALFPNGLLSAGSVYDEITATKAIKRIGVVDLGTLTWNYQSDPSTARFYNNTLDGVNTTATVKGNAVCAKYTTETFNALYSHSVDRCIAITTAGKVQVYDSSYTDSATFKAAMSGVMLYYELAEPIEVDLPEPINMDYEVSDFGTEEVISDTPTTLLNADIIYQFNAVDRIRDNSRHTAEAEVTLDTLQKGQLNLTVKDNGNIVLSNNNGVSKEFMPATPSGDPLHYAYIAAGAEWNDTDATITKTLEVPSYDDTHFETFSFEHLSKHWYLNGIGDITNEEMRRIYAIPHKLKHRGAYSAVEERTVFFDGNGVFNSLDFSMMFSASLINSITYKKPVYPSEVRSMFNCVRLRYFLPSAKRAYFYGYTGFVSNDLGNSGSLLEEIRIFKLRKDCSFQNCSLISKNSILYTINTSDATTAITITLHADAYARLGEDADVLAALEAKNTELSSTGGSISLVSA